MRLLKLLLILFVRAAGPAVAEPYDDAIAAFNKRDYATAERLMRPLAEQGNGLAQNALGAMYFNGTGGVPQDYTTGVSWFRKAAEQGDANGQSNLGRAYEKGQGVPRDYVQAHKWFNLAAAKGDAGAAESCDEVATKMTPAQIAEALMLAQEVGARIGTSSVVESSGSWQPICVPIGSQCRCRGCWRRRSTDG